MPTAPDPVLAADPPSNTPTAPGNATGSGAVSAPSVPGNATGSGAVSSPTAPESIQAGGQPSAPSAPGNAAGAGTVSAPSAPEVVAPVTVGESVAATVTITPASGSDNVVLYTADAAGTGGNAISIEYAAPVVSADTAVAVGGSPADDITVTPGTKARMVVTGTTGADGVLLYAGITTGGYGDVAHWTHDGTPLASMGARASIALYFDDWYGTYFLEARASDGTTLLYQVNENTGGGGYFPDEASWINAPAPGSGFPTVTAGVSSAAQVIAAVNASVAAAALVVASESGASTGPVAQVAAANLTLTPANALTLDGEVLTIDGAILTLD